MKRAELNPSFITGMLITTEEYFFCLDEPAPWPEKVRRLRISGWCVAKDGSSPVAIRARLGSKLYSGSFDRERPDVALYFNRPKTASSCGFTLDVTVPPGKSCLELQARRPTRPWATLVTRSVVGPRFRRPSERRLWKQIREIEARQIAFHIDAPDDFSKRRAAFEIAGWCFVWSGPALTEIRARVDGRCFPGRVGIIRPDVAAAHEGGSGALASGFKIDVSLRPWSRHLVLEARRESGRWIQFLQHRVHGAWRRPPENSEEVGNYAEWIRKYDRLTHGDRRQIRRHLRQLSSRPAFSILLPVYNSDRKWLGRAIGSVRAQLYPVWELCIVDDASSDPAIWPFLERWARRDRRIKIHRRGQNGHISAASNDALGLASGQYIGLLDHDDELAPTALYLAAVALNNSPALQFIYTDEDKLVEGNRRTQPHFKTEWNPDLFASQNYISHFALVSTEVARRTGGFRVGFEGAQDYDFYYRCLERIEPAQIHHVPRIAYHWRVHYDSTASSLASKPYACEAAIRAVQEHYDRSGVRVGVESHHHIYQRVRFAIAEPPPLVSLVIPSRDRLALLRACLHSIRRNTDYSNYEIIVVDNESSDSETLSYLDQLRRENVRVLRAEGEFNYSRLNNLGVEAAHGDIIALLNNDLIAYDADWLREMVSHALRPEIGAVGARLFYPDGRVQHGGVLLGVQSVAGHAHYEKGGHGYFARAHLTQNFSAVTAACMVLRKEVYRRVQGLDESDFPVVFNDVDFCLRLRQAGLRILWTPHAQLIHHESASRGLRDTVEKQRRYAEEETKMRERWGATLENDPFYNPNLSLEADQEFKLAFPPRAPKPWAPL